jgi:hypothetical protein
MKVRRKTIPRLEKAAKFFGGGSQENGEIGKYGVWVLSWGCGGVRQMGK